MTQSLKRAWMLALMMIATIAVYWPGLSGPLLFDDLANLSPLQAWQNGDLGWKDVVFGNESGRFGRPISMSLFLLSATSDGDLAWHLKFHSLILHCLSGLIVYFLALAMARRQSINSKKAIWLALAVSAVWMLHPMFVSTVLYAVQRMAMLSAFFIFATMLAYFHSRLCLERGQTRLGWFLLFVVVPATTLLGTFSKENGLLALPLCGVIEWAYFRSQHGRRRPVVVWAFLSVAVWLPIFVVCALLVFNPEFFTAGYQNRHFTLIERLLTQSRVLFEYVGGLTIPQAPSFTLYRDDYPISTGLFSPWTTTASLIGWVLIVAFAIAVRRAIPGFAAGIGIFLVGHSMESGIFPLLMYFEHRNYMPGFGLLWAVGSLVVFAAPRIALEMDNPQRLAYIAVAAFILVLAGSTFSRSLVWQSHEAIVEQSLKHYPDSRFARMEMANLDMNRSSPDAVAARSHYQHLRRLPRPSTRFIGNLGIVAVDCFIDQEVEAQKIDRAFNVELESVSSDVIKALLSLSDIVMARPCDGLSAQTLAHQISELSDRITLPDTSRAVWRLRYRASRLYFHAGLQEQALEQAEAAWAPGSAEVPVGMFIVALKSSLGQREEARVLLQEITRRISPTDRQGQALLEQYKSALK